MQGRRLFHPGADWKSWAVAGACLTGAFALRWALSPILGDRLPLLVFAVASMLSAWQGGLAPGLSVMVAGLFIGDWFFLPPLHSIGAHSATQATQLIAYVVVSLVGVLICESLHRSRRRLHELSRNLRDHARTLHQELEQRRQAEQALRKMEQISRAVIESNVIGIIILDFEGNILDSNGAFLEMIGYDRRDLEAGLNFHDLTPQEMRHLDQHAIEQLRARGTHVPFEKPLLRKDGARVPVLVGTAPHPGTNDLGICYIVDLTPQKQVEQVLRDSEQRFGAFMRFLPGAAWLKTLDGRYVYANPEAQRIFSTPLDKLLGKTDAEVFDEKTAQQFYANDQRVLRYGESFQTMEVLTHRDGAQHHSVVSRFAVPGPAGQPAYVGGVAIDITDRLAAEAAVRASEQRYRFLAESIPQIVFTARPDGVVSYTNQRFLDYVGVSREQVQKLGWIHFRHPDDREDATRRWEISIETGEPYECMYRMLRGSDQAWRWHLARATPMRDESGRVVMWFGTCTDIDDQKRAQDALRSSEEEFRAVFELAGSAKAMVDPKTGRFLRVNRKLCEMTGYSFDELLEMTFNDITHPDDREWSAEQAFSMLRGETPIYTVEKRYVRKDGQTIWVIVTATIIRDADGQLVRGAGVIQDITARKLAEQALRDSEASLARAQRIAGLGSWELDCRSGNVVWSQEMYRLFGVSPQEYQPTVDGFFEFVPPHEHESLRSLKEQALRDRQPYQIDHRIVLRDGSERYLSEQAEVMFDERGEPVKIVGTTLDITERKRIEQQLAAANQAKDQFLATLSHELRTPLTPVVLAVDSLRLDESLPERVRDDLDMIRRNVGLEAKLIDDLLDLTRVTRGKLELRYEIIEIHAALEYAIRSCCGSDTHDKRLHVQLDPDARNHHVRADAARLEQVFFNLLRNAVKFTPTGGSIRVRTRDLPNSQMMIEVHDSGIGIEPHVLPRLFNAFEQGDRHVTRQFGGLGLGLTICKAIIELHGGTIAANSDGRNRGSTFSITLPVIQPEAIHPSRERTAPASTIPPAGRPLRILLVEDHSPTAVMMGRLLQRLDYEVKIAGDLASARRLATLHQFDLLVSDLGLPDGSGLELMRDLREQFSLRGIALSGYGMEEDILQSKVAGFEEHLVKPISFDALEAAIHRVSGSRPADQLAR